MLKRKGFAQKGGYALLSCALLLGAGMLAWRIMAPARQEAAPAFAEEKAGEGYIRWVEFDIPLETLEQALEYDIGSRDGQAEMDWVELLAYAAAKNGGNFKSGARSAAMDDAAMRLQSGEGMHALTQGLKHYAYYREAYRAVLGGFTGEYEKGGQATYGLTVYSPIAKGFGFGHYDDFGAARTYGYKRLHLGNDLMGAIGTPVIAVEGGIVTALGWNEYGGWRVGIRSHDGLRYYYYAHMRKNSPFAAGLSEGCTVSAGDVIGYMGMTGYSKKENVENIAVPHLHFGMQLVFDESQLEGDNQIWIDVYHIVQLLERRRMPVTRVEGTLEYVRADTAHNSFAPHAPESGVEAK